MGGMAAQIPIKNDPAANESALDKVRQDKLREVKAGHDGTWVAHPGLVPIAKEIFDEYMTAPNQIADVRDDVKVSAAGPADGSQRGDHRSRPAAEYRCRHSVSGILAARLAAYRKLYGIDAVALRVTGLYGPLLSESRKEAFIESRARAPVWQFVVAAAAGTPMHLDAGADFVWEFNYVKDAAAAVARVLEAPALQWPVYNVGAGEGYPLSRIANVVNNTIPGADIKLGPGNLPDTPLRSVMSAQRIAEELGVRPRWSIEDGVRELAQWWLTGDYGRDI